MRLRTKGGNYGRWRELRATDNLYLMQVCITEHRVCKYSFHFDCLGLTLNTSLLSYFIVYVYTRTQNILRNTGKLLHASVCKKMKGKNERKGIGFSVASYLIMKMYTRTLYIRFSSSKTNIWRRGVGVGVNGKLM